MEQLRIHSEDLEELLAEIEASFQIKFGHAEIANHMTIDQIADLVMAKLDLQEGIECSSQITFFRLRQWLCQELSLEKSALSPHTKLDQLFPFRGRKTSWQKVFAGFAMRVPNLRPPDVIFLPALLLAVISLFLVMAFWEIGLPALLLSIAVLYGCIKFGKALPVATLGELVTHIVKYDYQSTRAGYGTYNATELRQTIFKLLTDDHASKKEKKTVHFNTKINYD